MARNPTARRLLISSVALAVALGLLVAAASAGHRSVKDGGTLVIGASAFDFIDPALVSDPVMSSACVSCTQAMWGVEDATCAMLLRYPAISPPVVRFRLVPEVARGYPAVSRDGKTYTFTIRTGFRFSTGTPVTAANYARAIARVLDPAMNSPAARYLQDVASVKAAGSRLIVRLTKKVPDFPARMTMPCLCPVPTDLQINPEGVPAPLPGSGPYYVAEFVRNSRVVLKRNGFYRGTRPHHVDQLVVQIGDPEVVHTQKVETGEADVDLRVPLPVRAEIAAKYGVNKSRFFSIRSGDMFYLFLNTERPLFRNNVKLRQAVNFAVDRTAYLAAFGGPIGSRTDSILPSGLPGYLNIHPYPVRHPDLSEGAGARARAHAKRQSRLLLVRQPHHQVPPARAERPERSEADRDRCGDQAVPVATEAAKVATRGEPWDLTDFRILVAWVDPSEYVDQLLDGRKIEATGNTDLSYFNSAHYNRLMDQAGSLSGNARYAAYGKLAVEIARDAAPMTGLLERNNSIFVSSRVGCVRAGPIAHSLDFAGLCLK
jgi:ABC-type transport system substrate-binding protein